ncbi:hypothetical protein DL93DRAFT_2086626 [Clavulina sp. PMI_390]|nr:hypothetical protein DL93DRAFT_2086626 [Clavulina sp. PMI_390]
MAHFDPAPSELIRALCERSYLPETMAIAKAALSDAEFMVNHHDRRLDKMTTDKSDHFALEYFGYAWYLCMVLSLRDGLSHIPMDAVDSGILFLLELMALNHYDQSEASTTTRLYLNELPRAIYRALGAEYAIGENKLYTHKMIHQIVVIHKRISSRPRVSQFLVKSWSETVIWAHVIHPSISVEAVCNNPGCERIDVPNLQCSRCRMHKYCSKDCQRA